MSSFPMVATAAPTLGDILVDIETQEELIAFNRDPLLYSVVAKRLAEEDPNVYGFLSLQYNQDILGQNVTVDDLQKTDNIRKFYLDRYLLAQLRGDELSKFRKDLVNFFYNNDVGQTSYNVTSKTVGMMYKLPRFYEYDIQVGEVLKDYNESTPKQLEDTGPVEFIAKLDMHRKKTPSFEYWFKDEDNRRFALMVEKNNPLMPLFDTTIQNNKVVISGYMECRKKNYNPYLFVKTWCLRV